jgi:hypothetical protein
LNVIACRNTYCKWVLTQADTNADEILRRIQLRHLDSLLTELEALNLRDARVLPDALSDKLRAAGIGHRSDARVSTVIDLVFRAQEAFLRQQPTTRPRSAA